MIIVDNEKNPIMYRSDDPRPFSEFETVGQHWHIELDEDLFKREAVCGITYEGQAKIIIQAPNEKYSPEFQQLTFWHEIAHALLDSAGLAKLSAKEEVVEQLGRGMYLMLITAKSDSGCPFVRYGNDPREPA